MVVALWMMLVDLLARVLMSRLDPRLS
jgi:hypothetical protein